MITALIGEKKESTAFYFNALVPFFMVLFIFFIPLSVSLKSIFLWVALGGIFCAPFYREKILLALQTPWAKSACLFFLLIAASCFWSSSSWGMRLDLLNKYSKLVFLPILAVGFIQPFTRKWALKAYLLAILITCVVSFARFYAGDVDPGEVFYNHIITGFMVSLGAYIAAFLFLDSFNIARNTVRSFFSQEVVWRLFYAGVMLLGSYQIFFINTGRTGYLSYALLMSFLFLQKFNLKKAVIALLVLYSVIWAAYTQSPIFQMRVHDLLIDVQHLQKQEKNTSLGFRVQFHDFAKTLFLERPLLGIGAGGFKQRYAQNPYITGWPKLNEPHSQYWLLLAEQGLVGLLCYLVFITVLAKEALKLNEGKWILLGVLLVFSVASFSDSIFSFSPVGMLLIALTALFFGERLQSVTGQR